MLTSLDDDDQFGTSGGWPDWQRGRQRVCHGVFPRQRFLPSRRL